MASSLLFTSNQENPTACVTLLFMVFTLLWLLWIWRKSNRSPTPPLPPGPRGVPLLGYLPFLSENLHLQFTDMAKDYGPIFKLQLGTKLWIVVSTPALVKQVVRDHDTTFSNRDPTIACQIASYGANDIAFGSYGSDWRKLRKVLVSQMLSKTNLDGFCALRNEEVNKSVSHIHNNRVGTPTNVSQYAFSTTINTIMRMLWGATLEEEKGNTFGEEYKKVVAQMINLAGKPNISDYFPVLAWFDIQGIERQAKKVQSVIDKMLSSAIEEQMKKLASGQNEELQQKHERKDFLQVLLENNEDGSTSLTMQQLKALLSDAVVGGGDTTATIIEWVMTELMRHPEEMRRVQEELTQTVGLDNLVDEFHLPKLRYLDAVIKETSRLHPAVPLLIPHCSSQCTTIGGYTIPKGSSVFINVWAIHRDPNVWDNPLEFRPRRFLSSDPSHSFDYSGNKFEYLPFGSGRRICAGISLVERMLTYILASFLHSFEWKLPNDVKLDISDKFGIVTKKKDPLIALPTPRLSKLELYA